MTLKLMNEPEGSLTLRAAWHHRAGGFVCALRGEHRLRLVEHHELLQEGSEQVVRRPFCTVCWRMLGD